MSVFTWFNYTKGHKINCNKYQTANYGHSLEKKAASKVLAGFQTDSAICTSKLSADCDRIFPDYEQVVTIIFTCITIAGKSTFLCLYGGGH